MRMQTHTTTDEWRGPQVRLSKCERVHPERGRFRTLLTGRLLRATILFCLAGVCGQTLVYGLSTWMPQLLVLAGYSLTSSLSFLLTVNIGRLFLEASPSMLHAFQSYCTRQV